MTGQEKVERLPVIVSSDCEEKLLGVPKLLNGTGRVIANAVLDTLNEWRLTDRIQGMSFDTTASNTGNVKGACLFLEESLGRELTYFACRHHIYEIVLRQAFESKFGKTKSPDVPLFEKFKKNWNKIDATKFKSGIADEKVAEKIGVDVRQRIIEYCLHQLQKSHYRDDYKEFLELVVLFLGGKLPKLKTLRRPGPTCHARWMAKAINSLKMFLLREQITFEPGHLDKLRDVCIFLVTMYVEAWFGCTNGVKAANQDLNLIKTAILYANVDEEISNGILDKMRNHLWYLSEELIALAFFDPTVSDEEKRKMVHNLSHRAPNPEYRIRVDVKADVLQMFSEKKLSEFVSTKTQEFFERFCIETEFLDPSSWNGREDYKEGYTFCQGLLAVNDTAERGVKLMTDFNKILARREEEKQFILQVVTNYRQVIPSERKSDLMKV